MEVQIMKRWIAFPVFLCLAVVVFAEPPSGECGYEWDLTEEEMLPYNDTIERFLDEHASVTFDQLSIGDIRELGTRLSVHAQQENYVRSARQASRVMPGSGHYMIGEPGVGTAFSVTSFILMTGTLVGTYFVLPERVQFHETDYINDSFRDISIAWRSQSIMSLLPAAGVIIAGGIVHGLLGELSAVDAERRARRQVDSGEKRFDPQPFIFPDAHGRLILGARMGL